MEKQNPFDEYLFRVHKFCNTFSIIIGIFLAIAGLTALFTPASFIGLIILFFDFLFIFLVYPIVNLKLSYYYDIKLIRNKLYEIDNNSLIKNFDYSFFHK